MPKIEAGDTSASFKIDGRPYPVGAYVPSYSDNNPASITGNVSIVPTSNKVSISSADLTAWTDNNDATFANLAAFWTYLQTFFFKESGGGGSVTPTNGLKDISGDIGLGDTLTENTTILGNNKSFKVGTAASLCNSIAFEGIGFLMVGDGATFGLDKAKIQAAAGFLRLSSTVFGGTDKLELFIGNGKATIEDTVNQVGFQDEQDYTANQLNNENAHTSVRGIKLICRPEQATKITTDVKNASGLAQDANNLYVFVDGFGWKEAALSVIVP